jgi:hypothetical protein
VTAPPLAVTRLDGSRVYRHPVTTEEVPSVTTILRVIAKPNVTRWAARKAAEYAIEHWAELEDMPDPEAIARISGAHEEISGAARDIGNEVHATIDAWCKGEVGEVTKGTNSYLNQFISFLFDEQPHFLYSEVTVWSRKYGYAGTADWIAKIGDHVYLGDNKTGKRVYAEVALQLSALAGADFIITESGEEQEIPPIECLAALHLRPRSWHFIPVGRREESFKAFLACREIVSWMQDIAPSALGGV